LPDQVAVAPPEISVQLEEFAMRVTVRELGQRYPGEKITQQPYNNPGFDILVGTLANPLAYVRVKATQGYQPTFHLSEGERQFSIDHADRYLLAIVYAIPGRVTRSLISYSAQAPSPSSLCDNRAAYAG